MQPIILHYSIQIKLLILLLPSELRVWEFDLIKI